MFVNEYSLGHYVVPHVGLVGMSVQHAGIPRQGHYAVEKCRVTARSDHTGKHSTLDILGKHYAVMREVSKGQGRVMGLCPGLAGLLLHRVPRGPGPQNQVHGA